VALVDRMRSRLLTRSPRDAGWAQTAALAARNRILEQRLAEQACEIEGVERLKRFLPSQIAQLIISSGDERALECHRRDVTVVACDLRGFTTFAETREPEEVITVLREYHEAIGPLIHKFGGMVEHFAGDGLIILFNDPLPCPDPSARAVQMAVEMRDAVAKLTVIWRRYGHEIGFGVGIAHGYATLGWIGFEGRVQYSVTGTVANLAHRLCQDALNGQILIDAKVHSAVETMADMEPMGDLMLKGFHKPVRATNVRRLRGMPIPQG
jgi:class 3 adenylate cyclase